jgi:hypothetical protein
MAAVQATQISAKQRRWFSTSRGVRKCRDKAEAHVTKGTRLMVDQAVEMQTIFTLLLYSVN